MRRAILLVLGAAASTTFLVEVKSHDAAQPTDSAMATPAGAQAPLSKHPRCKVATGSARPTPHGTLQVRVNLTDSRITEITAVVQPVGGRSTEINGYALPVLRREALAAQGTQIDTVTGATNTSNAYRLSLQAALDNAVLGHCG